MNRIIDDAVSQLLSPEAGGYDPLDIVRLGYNDCGYANWEWCLDHKMNLSDCVSGCYSGVSNFDHRRPHPHQRRPFYRWNNSFRYMTGKAESKEFINLKISEAQGINSFEDLRLEIYKQKQDAPDHAPGFGDLAVYDEALRIAWHMRINSPVDLLPREVYIHNGARWGAEALWHIGRITGRKIIAVDEAALESPHLPHEVFDKHLVDGLPCHHVENQLCIFHDLFEELELRIRKVKGLPERPMPHGHKNKIKKHYKLLDNK